MKICVYFHSNNHLGLWGPRLVPVNSVALWGLRYDAGHVTSNLHTLKLWGVSITRCKKTRDRCLTLFFQLFWNFASVSVARLPSRLQNIRGICRFYYPISQLRDITWSFNKTSYPILERAAGTKQARIIQTRCCPAFRQRVNWLMLIEVCCRGRPHLPNLEITRVVLLKNQQCKTRWTSGSKNAFHRGYKRASMEVYSQLASMQMNTIDVSWPGIITRNRQMW